MNRRTLLALAAALPFAGAARAETPTAMVTKAQATTTQP